MLPTGLARRSRCNSRLVLDISVCRYRSASNQIQLLRRLETSKLSRSGCTWLLKRPMDIAQLSDQSSLEALGMIDERGPRDGAGYLVHHAAGTAHLSEGRQIFRRRLPHHTKLRSRRKTGKRTGDLSASKLLHALPCYSSSRWICFVSTTAGIFAGTITTLVTTSDWIGPPSFPECSTSCLSRHFFGCRLRSQREAACVSGGKCSMYSSRTTDLSTAMIFTALWLYPRAR